MKQPDIVFMGDSVTQSGLFQKRLIQLVRDRCAGGSFSYFTSGVAGWSSYQGLQQLKKDILEMKPALITIYFGWNDHWIDFGVEDRDVAVVHGMFPNRVKNLRTIQLLYKVWVLLGRENNNWPPERVSASDFKANLEEMVRLAYDIGIQPVLFTAPTSHRKGHEPAYLKERWLRKLKDLAPLHQKYADIVREVAEKERAPLCDLAEDFKRLPYLDVANRHFIKDGIHLQDAGEKMMATFIYECFKEKGLWARVPGLKENTCS